MKKSDLPRSGRLVNVCDGGLSNLAMKKEQKVGLAIIGFAALIIVGIADAGGKATPAGDTTPAAGASAFASALASSAPLASSASTPTATPTGTHTKKHKKPPRSVAAVTPTPARSRVKAAPPPPAATPTTAPAAPAGCHPLSNAGHCYGPGEFCRNSDHGASGVAGDGEAIICEDNDGWRWEPV